MLVYYILMYLMSKQWDLFETRWQDPIERGCWFSCASCWTKTNEIWVCTKCGTIHKADGQIDEGQLGPKGLYDLLEHAGDEVSGIISEIEFSEWPLWTLIIPESRFIKKEMRQDVKISRIEWLKWKYKRLYIKIWHSEIKLETNGEKIRNYSRKTSTRLRRWKWYKWEKAKPAKAIQEFFEEKLGAKFADL